MSSNPINHPASHNRSNHEMANTPYQNSNTTPHYERETPEDTASWLYRNKSS
jgi:hypothetical protein